MCVYCIYIYIYTSKALMFDYHRYVLGISFVELQRATLSVPSAKKRELPSRVKPRQRVNRKIAG